ncbi:MAG: Lrp/AsnC family transcriptional regulator [Clostridia bacterium]|nr:Lrp/AsnC family transcriptional regulator [Clostridia bacterium]
MRTELLKLLSRNARYTVRQLADMLGSTEDEITALIKELEREGIICGYKAVIDWDSVDGSAVSAIIEIKVVPKADLGFEEVAEKIAAYSEVESVYLMSGGYDLNVVVKGKTLKEVAQFVAKELAVMDSVTSTATHFVMRRYKELDVCLFESEKDDRGSFSI